MLKYRIRRELIDRVSAVTSKYRQSPPASEELIDEIEWLKQRAASTASFADQIIETLNEILKEEELTEDEMKALTKYLKPTGCRVFERVHPFYKPSRYAPAPLIFPL